ncbi:MAG: hypothetical protein Q9181_000603 [Wetmoreana brouardii]
MEEEGNMNQQREVMGTRRAVHRFEPIVNDEVDAMDDMGRSQSQEFMSLARAFKQQAVDESKAHIEHFGSAVDSRGDALASLLKLKLDKMYTKIRGHTKVPRTDATSSVEQEKDIKVLTASMLSSSDAAQTGQKRALPVQSMARSPADSIVNSFNAFLNDYDRMTQDKSASEGSLPTVIPSRQDEELLEEVLQTHHGKATQRIRTLLHGISGGPSVEPDHSETKSETNEIWSSLLTDREQTGSTSERNGCTWDSVTRSAGRGIRRLVKDFPDRSEPTSKCTH